jgi:peptidoglycan L-alanyl-D-glutamate endopeptidase CwlK
MEVRMPNKFSTKSLDKLSGCHHALQDLCFAVLQLHDCKVLYGLRTVSEQQKLVQEGKSKTMNSKHLMQQDGTAHAVDLCVYPVDWNNTKRFYYFAGMVMALAPQYLPDGYVLRWGGDWDMDNDLDDQTFMDLVHFELRKKQ